MCQDFAKAYESPDRKHNKNYFDSCRAKVPNICLVHLVRCEDLVLFFVLGLQIESRIFRSFSTFKQQMDQGHESRELLQIDMAKKHTWACVSECCQPVYITEAISFTITLYGLVYDAFEFTQYF